MPTVKLLLNIGRADCQRLGLDPGKALAGASVAATPEAAAELLKKGWATDRPEDLRPAPEAAPHDSAGLPAGPGPDEATGPGAVGRPAGAAGPAIGVGVTNQAAPRPEEREKAAADRKGEKK